jgi:hypothetical protein
MDAQFLPCQPLSHVQLKVVSDVWLHLPVMNKNSLFF